MNARMDRLRDALRTSLWLVPCGLTAAAILLATLNVAIDRSLAGRPTSWPGWLCSGGPDNARAVLATIAGSMITVAGVTFSITVVALTLASTQFGPRLLRNFMRDTGNQVVLGTFIATFVYCLLVLRAVRGSDDNGFVPQISVGVGLLLAVLSLAVLIYFIHHISSSMQADNVIAAIGAECDAVIDKLFPKASSEAAGEKNPAVDERQDLRQAEREGRPVLASASGYVQAIDNDGLMSLASQKDLIVWLRQRPGDFVIAGCPLMVVSPAASVSDELERRANSFFVLGTQPTPIQDVEFAIDQLVQVAVRSLSPGINDSFTAISCIDRLGVSLAILARREFPSPCRFDDEGALRVIADNVTFEGVLDAALNQIRQSARTNVAVLIRMLEIIRMVAEISRREADRASLLHHAEIIHAAVGEAIPEERDRSDIETRYEAVRSALAPPDTGPVSRPDSG